MATQNLNDDGLGSGGEEGEAHLTSSGVTQLHGEQPINKKATLDTLKVERREGNFLVHQET